MATISFTQHGSL